MTYEEKLIEALLLMVVGMGVVFASLTFLAGMIWCFKFTDEFLNKRKISQYAKKIETQEETDEMNDELVAIIAAAAESTFHAPVVIRKIQFLGGKNTSAWRSSGRSAQMRSHQINIRK